EGHSPLTLALSPEGRGDRPVMDEYPAKMQKEKGGDCSPPLASSVDEEYDDQHQPDRHAEQPKSDTTKHFDLLCG
ncbi:MAG: hypothetical protein ABI414_07035, partial [Devosia sp.]